MQPSTSAILILGMHRSGTSALAGSLEQAGLELGDVFTRNPFNAKGNREHGQVMRLNDDVLAESGGAWDRPPARLTWTRDHEARRDAFIHDLRERARQGPRTQAWGFKDPRTLLTLDFWLESGVEFRFVGTFRHPHEVAASLTRRDRMPQAKGFELWSHYNTRLLELHARAPFPMLSFDLAPEAYTERLGRIVEELELGGGDADFFDTALRNSRPPSSESPLPAELAQLHDRLLALA
ncbi:MAG: sulfotransferase family protein [Planctomycetota bacterium]|jgi:hypothetical protein